MITPSRWFAGGKGLDSFRNTMLNDKQITKIVDFVNAKDCFTGISIGGGVNYFLWTKGAKDKCDFTSVHDGEKSRAERDLNEFPVFVRYNEALSIIHKVNLTIENKVSECIFSRNPFGLSSSFRGVDIQTKDKTITLHSSKGISYISKADVKQNLDIINKYKVMISKVTSEHAGEPNKNGQFTVLSTIKILKPNEVCTDSYLIIFVSDNLSEVEHYTQYAKTKFYRFLLLQSISSINLSKDKFDFIPMIDFKTAIDINDKYLYDKFHLSTSEIKYIETMINEKNRY